jgi:membrane-bound lytic murein transglycosylase A
MGDAGCAMHDAERKSMKDKMRVGCVSLLVVLFAGSPVAWGGQAGKADSIALRDDLDRESLRQAIERSLEFLARVPPHQIVGERPRKVAAQEVRESLLALLKLLDIWNRPEKLAEAIRSRFELVESAGNSEVVFTGYYQPVLAASLTETEEFRYPIYGKPQDLVDATVVTLRPEARNERVAGRLEEDRFVPYFSREEIDRLGRLKGKGYEIAWVRDPAELFFLHVQGSGILQLADGRRLHLNYATTNGRPYTSIGKVLIDSGKIPPEGVSMQQLQRYLKERPEERDDLLARNERYVFFRFVERGPLGSLEVPLTAGRSLATDPAYFPKGAPGFMTSRRPLVDGAGNFIGWQPFSRFVVNQDTGAAIRGPQRADLYFGTGDQAGWGAGFMKSAGRLYFLVLKKKR